MDRIAQLHRWLEKHSSQPYELTPASADASFRRYFRATYADGSTRIVMDAPPTHEDCRPFVKIAQLFEQAGAHVPHVYAENLEEGFLLLSDLGDQTYLNALQKNLGSAHELYADALGALISIQLASRPDVLPPYSREKLLQEMELFPVWYINKHKGVTLTDEQTTALYEVFDAILDVNMAEPKVFVHRDYHARNLMCTEPNPGVLDFQDAVYGPLSYDLVSLFKDAYIEWDEEFTLDMLARYWQTARKLNLPVREDFSDFHRDYEFMGAQRHLKVLGIFARLYHRDGKDGYLKDLPLVHKYLRKTCERYRELAPLRKLLDVIDPIEKTEGLTF